MPESCYSSKQLFLKVVSESLPKLLPKAIPQNCFPKLFPKHLCKAIAPKRLCFKPVFESGPNAILQSGSRKLLPKVAAKSFSSKLRSKITPQSCCSPFKTAVQSCRAKLLLPPKAVPERHSPKLLSKAAPNSWSSKLLTPKFVSESCFPKFVFKATPQSCRFSKTGQYVRYRAIIWACACMSLEKNQHQNVFPPHFPWLPHGFLAFPDLQLENAQVCSGGALAISIWGVLQESHLGSLLVSCCSCLSLRIVLPIRAKQLRPKFAWSYTNNRIKTSQPVPNRPGRPSIQVDSLASSSLS